MFVRTIVSTVTFAHPFALAGCDGVQPPGTYTVETDEEMIQTPSATAYRRLSTLMRFPAGSDAARSSHIIAVDAADLDAALARDVPLPDALPAAVRNADQVSMPAVDIDIPAAGAPQPHGGRWLGLTRLTCLALLFGGVWFAGILLEI